MRASLDEKSTTGLRLFTSRSIEYSQRAGTYPTQPASHLFSWIVTVNPHTDASEREIEKGFEGTFLVNMLYPRCPELGVELDALLSDPWGESPLSRRSIHLKWAP